MTRENLPKWTAEVELTLEKAGVSKATYSDVTGVVFDKVYVKREFFNGKTPPKKLRFKLSWE